MLISYLGQHIWAMAVKNALNSSDWLGDKMVVECKGESRSPLYYLECALINNLLTN